MPYCDVIMKGGVTSGVVYPRAIHELSKAFEFKNVGGTSAGAIAACLTAAAEYRRQTQQKSDGFDALENLPKELKNGFLFSLFTPDPPARPLFNVLFAALGNESIGYKIARIAATALVQYWWLTLLSLFAMIAGGPGTSIVVFVVAFVLLALRTLRNNRFGLCSGKTLMTWLHEKTQSAAGVTAPLTFGQLAAAGVTLRMVTTNLTHGRPYHFPRHHDNLPRLYFERAEMERIFPADIVDHLVSHSPHAVNNLHALPDSDDLPIIFVARLSLSFPVLFTLVPIHAHDNAFKPPKLEVCWFMDGGLTSNFPMNLFDEALPKWPTFGLELRGTHPSYKNAVWMVNDNSGGRGENWNAFALTAGGYIGAVINTMQNWRDNALQRVPGYIDRIVHINLEPTEGGLNLNMPAPLIEKLANYGREAGAELVRRFTPGSTHTMNWDNHRFIRYLTTMALLEKQLREVSDAIRPQPNDGGTTYWRLLRRTQNVPHTGYWTSTSKLRRVIGGRTAALLRLHRFWTGTQPAFRDHAPRPAPDIQIAPRY